MNAPGLRLDLHNHTSFSSDGVMSPAELLMRPKREAWGASPSPITTPWKGRSRPCSPKPTLLCPGSSPASSYPLPTARSSGSTSGRPYRAVFRAKPSPSSGNRGPRLPAPPVRHLPPRDHRFPRARAGGRAGRHGGGAQRPLTQFPGGQELGAACPRHSKPQGAGSDAHGRQRGGSRLRHRRAPPLSGDLVDLVGPGRLETACTGMNTC